MLQQRKQSMTSWRVPDQTLVDQEWMCQSSLDSQHLSRVSALLAFAYQKHSICFAEVAVKDSQVSVSIWMYIILYRNHVGWYESGWRKQLISIRGAINVQLHAEPWVWVSVLFRAVSDNLEWVTDGWWFRTDRLHQNPKEFKSIVLLSFKTKLCIITSRYKCIASSITPIGRFGRNLSSSLNFWWSDQTHPDAN